MVLDKKISLFVWADIFQFGSSSEHASAKIRLKFRFGTQQPCEAVPGKEYDGAENSKAFEIQTWNANRVEGRLVMCLLLSTKVTGGVAGFHVTSSNSKIINCEVFWFYIPNSLKMTWKYIFSQVSSPVASFVLKIQHQILSYRLFSLRDTNTASVTKLSLKRERPPLVNFSSLDSLKFWEGN